jgi:hypothetical protein
MVALHVAVFPQSSVAVHVLVTLYLPGQLPGVVTSEEVIATDASHKSEAAGVPNTGVAGQLITELPGHEVKNGAVVSVTLIV